jgi:hypothetical protein
MTVGRGVPAEPEQVTAMKCAKKERSSLKAQHMSFLAPAQPEASPHQNDHRHLCKEQVKPPQSKDRLLSVIGCRSGGVSIGIGLTFSTFDMMFDVSRFWRWR